jgi:ubiquinone/menaquinone biosynthesis C-methylase UbiE
MSDRKEYWNNDYFIYWKNRVREANESVGDTSNMIQGDKKTLSDTVNQRTIDLLMIEPEDTVLEVGCGFGRNLENLRNANIYACDISQSMIDEAKKNFPNVIFKVSEAEKTGYDNDFFDKIICIGTFDALYQKQALVEFNRILKPSGAICITGKNMRYKVDDQLAKEAEENARKKGHPNYFTDYRKLSDSVADFGFSIVLQLKFVFRGDFAEYKVSPETDEFYEYIIILEKTKNVQDTEVLPEISSKFSVHF